MSKLGRRAIQYQCPECFARFYFWFNELEVVVWGRYSRLFQRYAQWDRELIAHATEHGNERVQLFLADRASGAEWARDEAKRESYQDEANG